MIGVVVVVVDGNDDGNDASLRCHGSQSSYRTEHHTDKTEKLMCITSYNDSTFEYWWNARIPLLVGISSN